MTDFNRLRNYLALWYTEGIGPTKFYALLKAFPALHDIFSAPSSYLEKLGLSSVTIQKLKSPAWEVIDKILAWSTQANHGVLTWEDDNYPYLLRQIAVPPPVLFFQGQLSLLNNPQIAMVGSRNPTPAGKETARQFAYHLATSGFTVTSGLALGIDGASHRGALDALGKTIAVLGTGLDIIYPRSHKTLAAEIASQGLLVSEYPIGIEASAHHFPRRNRIISGLSQGVLVVEAALASGSLITAKYALEQNREVFAIPGSIHSPLSRGCHALIRQGAKLVETAQDIFEEIRGILPSVREQSIEFHATEAPHFPDSDYNLLLKAIDFTPVSMDALMNRTGLTSARVSSMLLILELQGQVSAISGGYVKNM